MSDMQSLPQSTSSAPPWSALADLLEGELHVGELMRRIYATDASAYQEMPVGVCLPHSVDDIQHVIRFVVRTVFLEQMQHFIDTLWQSDLLCK